MNDDIARVDELAGKLRFSKLTDEEQTELDALLLRLPEARQRFVDHLILENDLHEDAGIFLEAPMRKITSQKTWLLPLGIAAVFLLGLGFLAQLIRLNSTNVADKSNGAPSVGVVRRAVDVDSPQIHSGRVLLPGSLPVNTGLVQLDLYSGVSLIVEGPAEMEIVSPDKVILNSGKIRANVPPPARGFRIVAGKHELVDLGTEFGVSIDKNGDGELHVINGEVEIKSSNKLLTTGEAVSLNRDGTSPEIPVDSTKFSSSDVLTKRSDERFTEWQSAISIVANDPDTVALYDFQIGKNNRLRNLAVHSSEGTEGIVVGCRQVDGRWAEKSSLYFRSPSDRVRVSIPGSFNHLTIATWVKVDSIELLSLPFIQSENKQALSLFWILHHGHQFKPMNPHFAETTDPLDGKGDRRTYFSGGNVLSTEQTGSWMHFAVTLNNTGQTVMHYVNGKVVDQQAIEDPRPVGIGLGDIGNWPSRDWARGTKWEIRHLIGKMDEFLISQRAFSEAEILNLYQAGRP